MIYMTMIIAGIISSILVIIPAGNFIVCVSALILSFIYPDISASIIITPSIWLLISESCAKKRCLKILEKINLTAEEKLLARKYVVYIFFPFYGKTAGANWASFQIFGIIISFIFAYKDIYLYIPIFITISILGMIRRFILNPIFYYQNMAEISYKKGRFFESIKYERMVSEINNIIAKIH